MPSKDLQKKIDAIVKKYIEACRWVEYSKNRLTREGARLYVLQHSLLTRHSRRAWAYVVGNCPEMEVRRFIVKENLYEEEGIEALSHYLKLVAMGEAVGLKARQIHDAVALPSTRAAFLIWETLTRDRHWIIGCAAKAALEQSNQDHCGKFSYHQGHLWMSKLGLSREAVDFWLMHDELDQVHGTGAFDAVLKFLDSASGVSEQDVLTAVEDSVLAFNLFFDGIAHAAESQPRGRAA